MNKKTKEILKLLSMPLVAFVVYLILALIWKVFSLPTDEQLITIVSDLFSSHGLIIIFFSAFIEGILLLGQYFPGSFIIFLGVISAGKDAVRATEVVATVSLAFFFAYLCNYLMGRYGWYTLFVKFGLKENIRKTEKKIQKYAFKTIFFSYWAPDFATISATAAGVLRFSLKRFLSYSILSIIIWETIWGIIVFSFGIATLRLVSGVFYALLIFVVWMGLLLIKHFFFSKKRRKYPLVSKSLKDRYSLADNAKII